MVSCGKKAPAVTPTPAEKPKVIAPDGVRITDARITNVNASLSVAFSINGTGRVESFAPFSYGRSVKYKRWDNEPLRYGEHAGKSLREIDPAGAVAHDALCEANEKLYATLQSQGQIAFDNKHEFSFPLSSQEQELLAKMVAAAKSALLAAILDGSAEIRVDEVGCDYPHDQILGIKVAGASQEYALIQELLREFNLKVDGSAECKDLAGAIRTRQAQAAQRAAELAAHQAKRAQGYHVVALKRCWECGRTVILGEYGDDFAIMRMPPDVYAACVEEQRAAHKRSLESVPEGTLLSSVGFVPSQESKFDFRVAEGDWYCGC